MLNTYSQMRTAATAGIVACLAMANMAEANVPTPVFRKTGSNTVIKLGFEDSSRGQSHAVQLSTANIDMGGFKEVVSNFYDALCLKQKMLDPALDQVVSASIWDLYETE